MRRHNTLSFIYFFPPSVPSSFPFSSNLRYFHHRRWLIFIADYRDQSFAEFRYAKEEDWADDDDDDRHDEEPGGHWDDGVSADQCQYVDDVDDPRQNESVEMAAESGSDRCHDADDRNADGEVVPRLQSDSTHDEDAPIGTDHTDDCHQDDGSGRGHLLADSK